MPETLRKENPVTARQQAIERAGQDDRTEPSPSPEQVEKGRRERIEQMRNQLLASGDLDPGGVWINEIPTFRPEFMREVLLAQQEVVEKAYDDWERSLGPRPELKRGHVALAQYFIDQPSATTPHVGRLLERGQETGEVVEQIAAQKEQAASDYQVFIERLQPVIDFALPTFEELGGLPSRRVEAITRMIEQKLPEQLLPLELYVSGPQALPQVELRKGRRLKGHEFDIESESLATRAEVRFDHFVAAAQNIVDAERGLEQILEAKETLNREAA